MAFYANTFIFDDIPSEFYNLYFGGFGDSGEAITPTASDISLITQKLFRKPVPLYYGSEQTPVLSFPLSMYSPDEITAQDFSLISSWLFGQMNYVKLRICQSDMSDIYFNCFLTAPMITRVGNIIQGISCTVVCDSPWAWKSPRTYTYTYGDTYNIVETRILLNESANNFYTYPTELIITANTFGGTIHITNMDDDDREFILSLSPNEVLTLDCENKIITSTTTTYPLENFNKNWLRFLRGYNSLEIDGNISELEFTVPVAVKIGG